MHVTEQEGERERDRVCERDGRERNRRARASNSRARPRTNGAFVEGFERKHVIFVLQNPLFTTV